MEFDMDKPLLRIEEVTIEPKLIQAFCQCGKVPNLINGFNADYHYQCECGLEYESRMVYPRIEYYHDGKIYNANGYRISSGIARKPNPDITTREGQKAFSDKVDEELMLRQEIIDLRKEVGDLKAAGDTKLKDLCKKFWDDYYRILTPEKYVEFKVSKDTFLRTDADGKLVFRVDDKTTPFIDYLDKKFEDQLAKDTEEWLKLTHRPMIPSFPKTPRELTHYQCKEVARLAWSRPYIVNDVINVYKKDYEIRIRSNNLYCLIDLKDLSVHKTCMHFHTHHKTNTTHNREKIAAKFKEWGIEPLKEKTIDDLTRDQLFTILETICPEFPSHYRDAITWLADGSGIAVWLHNKVHTLHIRNNLVVQVTDPNMPQKKGWGHRVHLMLHEWGIKPVSK